MSRAVTTKPVLPPISASTSPQLTSAAVGDELTEALSEARACMAKLRQAGGDLISKPALYCDVVGSLSQSCTNNFARRAAIFRVCQEEGLCDVCMQLWRSLDLQEGNNLETLEHSKKMALENWMNLLVMLVSGTDTGDSEIISNLAASSLIGFCVDILRGNLLAAQRPSRSQCFIGVNLLGILYNFMKKWDGGVKAVRATEGSERAVAKFTTYQDPAVKTLAIIVLTFLLSEEDQKKMLDATKTNINYMLRILEDCLKSKATGHAGQYGYSAAEIMDGLTRMAATEENKEKIVVCGALPLLAKVLAPGEEFSSEEQEEACKCLWTLSFKPNNKTKIAADVDCMEGLRRSAASSRAALRKAAEGALWVIENEAKYVQSLETKGSAQKDNAKMVAEGHIMLSYNWGIQKQVIRIKESLESAGHRVWIDIECMSGSTLEAMSRAIEEAWLVLIFFTEKYKQSSPCRLEAEYTHSRNKKFVPIKMEPGYKPDGWLGMLIANKLFIDFTKEGQWEVALHRLHTEIGRMMHEDTTQAQTAAVTYSESTESHKDLHTNKQNAHIIQNVTNYASLSASSWKKEDITQWLMQNNLEPYAQKFEGFTGRHVVSLRRLMDSAPEFFYQSLKKEFGFGMLDMLTFADMLQTLT